MLSSNSIHNLLRRIHSLYALINSDADRILLFNFAQICHVSLQTILTVSPKEPLPFPPPPSLPLPGPFSEQELHDYVVQLAEHIHESRKRYDPSAAFDPDRDWHDAEIYLAADVLEGKIRFDTALESPSYWRLENIWLNEVVRLRAYHIWETRGRPMGMGGDKADYFEECQRCIQLLVTPGLKAPLDRFQETKTYLLTRYLQTGTLDIRHGMANSLFQTKMSRLSSHAQDADGNSLPNHVAEYLHGYYDNIVAAVENICTAATQNVLNSLHRSQEHDSQCSIMNCFEAAIAIYFLPRDVITTLWQSPIPRDGTF